MVIVGRATGGRVDLSRRGAVGLWLCVVRRGAGGVLVVVAVGDVSLLIGGVVGGRVCGIVGHSLAFLLGGGGREGRREGESR